MWSETPPTERGWYWARERQYPERTEGVFRFLPPFDSDPCRPRGTVVLSQSQFMDPELFDWGPKVPRLTEFIALIEASEAIKAASQELLIVRDRKLSDNLDLGTASQTEAYRIGVEEAQFEIVSRLRLLSRKAEAGRKEG